uniref:Uncharacterized protein n=1 Tax=Ascaris lumbricoides TaxID=6252 RepID=A0A0M3IQ52_ASCLU
EKFDFNFQRSASVERKQNEEIHSILVTTEKKLLDAEDKIKNLQRELSAFELRNNELLDETIWLKQQIGQPEVPLRLRCSNDIAKGITESERRLHEELEKCKYELVDQQKSHEDRIARLTKEYDQKISLIQGELLNERIINEKLNAAIDEYRKAEDRRRINEALISASSPSSSKVIATRFYTPPPSSVQQDDGQAMTNCLSGNSEVDNCKKLTIEDEETINDDEDENINIPSTSMAISFQPKVCSSASPCNINTRIASATHRTRIGNNFKNVYTLTETMEPIKVISFITLYRYMHISNYKHNSIQSDRKTASSCNINTRIASATHRTRIGNNFKNVYTLTETMEPIKVIPFIILYRYMHISNYKHNSIQSDRKTKIYEIEAAIVMRGSSAPMLFKSRSRAHRLQRSHEDTMQTDDDSYSTHLQENRTNDEFPLVICCFFFLRKCKKKNFFFDHCLSKQSDGS